MRREHFAICLAGGSLPSGKGYWHPRPVRPVERTGMVFTPFIVSDGGLVPVFSILWQFCEIGAIVAKETRDSASF